ncbi:hypothetical protein [Mesorhizobium sp.]|uniref:hypothetical protein n=1 Tax=Mesorhizobium sp. TaxID=1871066 RepID=UPI000FE49C72|nr:hypothetical protein [Mesorhizobium sp.]RWQ14815.1 MAG: hypothetical protein EOR93_27925 [Mesorhizobium sp.]
MTKLTNIRIEFGYDLGGVDTHADVVLFDIDGSPWLEYLDDDGTLCGSNDSNVLINLPKDVAADVFKQLEAWLADDANFERSMRWVSADEQGELDGGTIPAGADAEAEKATFLTKLLGQCGPVEDRDGILAGRVEITRAA